MEGEGGGGGLCSELTDGQILEELEVIYLRIYLPLPFLYSFFPTQYIFFVQEKGKGEMVWYTK